MMPIRIQRKRTKGWKMPENTVYVGRPSDFGNPFYVGLFRDYTHDDAVKSFENYVNERPSFKEQIITELKGKNLSCWCSLDSPCHADILLKIANQ